MVSAVLAGVAVSTFLLWTTVGFSGPRPTLSVDDIGQLVAAWIAAAVCAMAASRVTSGRTTWALFAASSFAWGAGELIWCYDALAKHTPVPFPSLADVGFLAAVPLAFAALLSFPSGHRSRLDRFHGVLDGCIIATSLLFASWATVLGPLYRTHHGGVMKQAISLAYPMSDVIMVSLVIILIARGGRPVQRNLVMVMAGVVAFAVADSAFTYLTDLNSYTGGSSLDTGWVAGYLLDRTGCAVVDDLPVGSS